MEKAETELVKGLGAFDSQKDDNVTIEWVESGGPHVREATSEGFGTLIGKVAAEGQLNGSIAREWHPGGLRIRLVLSRARLTEE